jgi:methanogenic corrinoid protein MtbC1
MEAEGMVERLVEAVANMREQDALQAVQELLERGKNPLQILELCRNAMSIVGQRFEHGEYFLPELIMAGEMVAEIADIVKPRITMDTAVSREQLGLVVIGTVRGDLHDIGKNIVKFMLEVNGLEVHDLGVDVPAEDFIHKIEAVKPEVVGLSGFMTVAFDRMKETVEAIESAGLRGKVKIMIGGGMVDDHIRKYTGADAYGKDAMAAVALARAWVQKE